MYYILTVSHRRRESSDIRHLADIAHFLYISIKTYRLILSNDEFIHCLKSFS